jgi:hypothetical protein
MVFTTKKEQNITERRQKNRNKSKHNNPQMTTRRKDAKKKDKDTIKNTQSKLYQKGY